MILFLCLVFCYDPQSAIAAMDVVANVHTIQVGESYELPVTLTGLDPNSTHFLKCAFKENGTSVYVGETNVGTLWVSSKENYREQKKVVIDEDGHWAGAIKCRFPQDIEITANDSPYIFKIGRYTEGGSLSWSDENPVMVVASENSNIPLEKSSTVAATVAQISIHLPAVIKSDESINPTIEFNNVDPGTYSVKFEGRVVGESNWYAIKTVTDDGTKLSWNAPWDSFPLTTLPEIDEDNRLSFSVDKKYVSKELEIRLKIKKDTKITTSDITNVRIEELRLDESVTENKDESTLEHQMLQEIKTLTVGSTVIASGVIVAQPDLVGSKTFYIEDESAGIKVIWDNDQRVDLQYENLVEVRGELREAFNELYIKAEEVRVTGDGQVFAALVVSASQVDESTEGLLVQMTGEVQETSGDVFVLGDESGLVPVYIRETTGIEKPRMRKGDTVQVTGVVSQYKETYRILPRFLEDIIMNPSQFVLGSYDESRQLPKTGSSFGVIGLLFILLGIVLRCLGRNRSQPTEFSIVD